MIPFWLLGTCGRRKVLLSVWDIQSPTGWLRTILGATQTIFGATRRFRRQVGLTQAVTRKKSRLTEKPFSRILVPPGKILDLTVSPRRFLRVWESWGALGMRFGEVLSSYWGRCRPQVSHLTSVAVFVTPPPRPQHFALLENQNDLSLFCRKFMSAKRPGTRP